MTSGPTRPAGPQGAASCRRSAGVPPTSNRYASALLPTRCRTNETVKSLVEAEPKRDVAELGRRASVPIDRIAPAFEMLPTAIGRRAGRAVRLVAALTLGCSCLVLAIGVASAAPSAVHAIPPGCWLGKGVHSGTFASGPVKGKVTSGTIELHLWVGKGGGDAIGLMRTGGIGKGTLSLSGSSLVLTVVMTGKFDVTGSATKLVVNGKDRWKGKAVGKGQFITVPIDFTLPVKKAPLEIVSVTPSRVTLRYGKAQFVASRVKTLPKPVGSLCS